MANNIIRLKIEKTTICNGRVVVADEEVTVQAKVADNLVERGLAIVVGEEVTKNENHEGGDRDENADDELAGMTVDELKEYAAEAGVDLTGKTKKADILAAIREAM